MKAKITPEKKDDTIGFRLDSDWRAELVSRASRHGMSRHELARLYVIEMLSSDVERESLREAVRNLNEQLQDFREDVLFAVEALLHCAGTLSKAQAKAWVDSALKSE